MGWIPARNFQDLVGDRQGIETDVDYQGLLVFCV